MPRASLQRLFSGHFFPPVSQFLWGIGAKDGGGGYLPLAGKQETYVCFATQCTFDQLCYFFLWSAEINILSHRIDMEFFLSHSRCDAGYTGQHCEKKDYSVLYVVPGPVRFQYVLIAAVIGTIQIAIICVVVLCITRLVRGGVSWSSQEEERGSCVCSHSAVGVANLPVGTVALLEL